MINPYESSVTLTLWDTIPSEQVSKLKKSGGPSGESQTSPTPDAVEEPSSKGISLEDALDQLFPPQHLPDGSLCRSSREHISRMDVINLQESLEYRCKKENARPHGVCPVREAIYAEAMDEIMRQTTILCPERGLLLAELRNELQETNETYDLLFESACQYAVRKGIQRDLKRTMEAQLQELSSEARRLENRVHEYHAKYDGIDKRFREQQAAEEKRHQEEVQFLKKGNLQLTTEIKRLSM